MYVWIGLTEDMFDNIRNVAIFGGISSDILNDVMQ